MGQQNVIFMYCNTIYIRKKMGSVLNFNSRIRIIKKGIILLSIGLCYNTSSQAQAIDTIYYDSKGRGVENKEFASFVRYAYYSENANYRNRLRDFYITGELYQEGCFVSIDRYDREKTTFDSDYKIYYKTGVVKEEGIYNNGVKDGDCTTYYETGLIHRHAHFVQDKIEGIFYEFSSDGESCKQVECKNGEPATPYYFHSTKSGNVTKYRLKDHSLVFDTPTMKDKQIFYKDGKAWEYYQMNGILLMLNQEELRSYGKYYTLFVMFQNNSARPIVFNPSLVTAYGIKKEEKVPLNVLEAKEYMKRVTSTQNWNSFFYALGESMAAAQAGVSYSSTKTTSSYSGGSSSTSASGAIGTSSTVAGGSAVGAARTNSAAIGVEANVTRYAGSNTTKSQTFNYNGAAAYQASLIASDRIASYNNAIAQEREIKEQGCLKITTLDPGETICGYIYIKYEKVKNLSINIIVDSIIYPFAWEL